MNRGTNSSNIKTEVITTPVISRAVSMSTRLKGQKLVIYKGMGLMSEISSRVEVSEKGARKE